MWISGGQSISRFEQCMPGIFDRYRAKVIVLATLIINENLFSDEASENY